MYGFYNFYFFFHCLKEIADIIEYNITHGNVNWNNYRENKKKINHQTELRLP